jgi:23S rRNA pseudouridine1911/1915/1917 synthase
MSVSEAGDRILRTEKRDAGVTLAAFLRRHLAEMSWSKIRGLCEARRVMIDGNLELDSARRLRGTEVVKILRGSQRAPASHEDIEVRFLDSQVIVVEKPSGVTTVRHPEELNWPKARRQLQPTLDELLPTIIADMEGPRRGGGPPPRLRAVHRLDRETSGLIVFARTPEAESHLGHQFRKHTVERLYRAIVFGAVESRTIESDLVDDRGDGLRGSTTLKNVGKRAITHVTRIESLRGFTLVECRLETGRTHQIRIHLSEQGHRLCGEPVYTRPPFGKETPDTCGAPRLALHAAVLGFTHPISEQRIRFESGLPADLNEFLESLRRKRPASPLTPP